MSDFVRSHEQDLEDQELERLRRELEEWRRDGATMLARVEALTAELANLRGEPASYSPWLTASAVDRFIACAASAVLPRTQEDSAAATKGTQIHDAELRPGQLPRVFYEWFGEHEPRYEVSLAWRPRDGSVLYLGERLERDYALPHPDWLAGTMDAGACRHDVISVADLKTGYNQTRGSLGDPARAGQLLLLAWLLWQYLAERRGARDWRPDRVRVAWLMRPENGQPTIEDAEVAPDALERWAAKLAARAERTRAGVPEMRPGPHCTHCPCFNACPAQDNALRRLAELPPGGPIDDEAAALAYYAIAASEKAVAQGSRALLTYSERKTAQARAAGEDADGDIRLGGDRVLRVLRSTRREIDARLALQSGIIPPAAATYSVTAESIRRAMPGVNLEAIMERLAEAGAVRSKQTAPFLAQIGKKTQ